MQAPSRYIPAFNQRWLTPLFDLFMRTWFRETLLKRKLVAHANLRLRQRVLDLGSGTGTLAVLMKEAYPEVEVIGLDGDEQVVGRARSKAKAAGLAVRFDHGLATALPYEDVSFDTVVSSFVVHHLTSDDKLLAMREAWRVLRPGGKLHILDFGRPRGAYAWMISLVFRLMEEVADNIAGRLPDMLCRAGFVDVMETDPHQTLFGTVAFLEGTRPNTATD